MMTDRWYLIVIVYAVSVFLLLVVKSLGSITWGDTIISQAILNASLIIAMGFNAKD